MLVTVLYKDHKKVKTRHKNQRFYNLKLYDYMVKMTMKAVTINTTQSTTNKTNIFDFPVSTLRKTKRGKPWLKRAINNVIARFS